MPNTLPHQIKVTHTTWDVVRNDDECDALGSDGHALAGGRRLVVRSGLHPDREREVALHETLHACISVTTLGLSYDKEEKLVSALTGPLLDVLRRNPRLVTFLQQ